MILNVQILNPALRTFAKILVERHSIPVERKLFANLFIIVLYVNVHLNGLAIHIINATNVSLIMTVRTKFLHNSIGNNLYEIFESATHYYIRISIGITKNLFM